MNQVKDESPSASPPGRIPVTGAVWPLIPGRPAAPLPPANTGGHGLRRTRHHLLEALYPSTCPACGNTPDHTSDQPDPRQLCVSCHGQLIPVIEPYCSSCGEPFPLPTPNHFRCSNCGGRRQPYEFAIAPCLCEDLLLELIHRFKYHGAWTLRQPLARLMLHTLEEPRVCAHLNEPRRWWLVPVPIHWRRQRQRGYNQASLLAAALGQSTGLPLADCLRRIHPTRSQATLNRTARIRNLRGAFAPRLSRFRRTPQKGDGIILIDDVFTTGSTAAACSRTLKRSFKVDKVVVITAGRG